MNTISFTPLGGAQEIGANSYRLRLNGHDILLDCGVHPKKDGIEALPDFSLLDRAPEAVFISHGHVDHCGALPRLLKQFPTTRAYATRATVGIIDRMLHNSVSVMTTLAKERGIAGYPLYSHEDVDEAISRTVGLQYEEHFRPRPDCPIECSFHQAGHVLGGASALLRTPHHTVLYTGDICAADQELVGGLTPLDPDVAVDTLIIECTYGADDEAGDSCYEEEIERFAREVSKVIERGGVALVPCFALGRAQELLNIIARLQETGRIPDVRILSSGLGRAIYEVYGSFQDYLRPDANLRPLKQFDRIGNVWNPRTVRKLLAEPAIIVATSGMLIENTPSALITREMVQHREHGIFFVGYLDPDSLGHKLLHAKPGAEFEFQLGAPPVEVVLENMQWFYFSAHAPREALCSVVKRTRPKNVIFVHGDPEAIEWMQANAGEGCTKFAPVNGETVVIEA